MEITETLDDLGKKFERWHTDKYNALHYNTIQSIESLANTTTEETDLIKLKILDIANLISVKLDGNRTNITNINDINTILNKIEATSDSINLKDFNIRLNEIQTLKTLIGNNTSSSNASIFERLATLESTNLSTENVNNQIKLKNAFSFSYLSNKRRRRTQEDKTPLSFSNTLVLYTMRGNMYRILCCKDNCRRNQERQHKKLAQHTIKRTERLTADVPRMWQMMHTLLAIILLIMRLRVYMQRRQHKHWQEHRQQHQRRIISPCRLFHFKFVVAKVVQIV